MPPLDTSSDRGWKAFFALLMILQIIALGVMWRTYDTVQASDRLSTMSEYKIEHVILPAIRNHDGRLQYLEKRGP
jgi:hypothetical protein